MARRHHNNCYPSYRNLHSGSTEDGFNFMDKYNLNLTFNLECLGCCFAYLRSRNYQEVSGALYDRVCYSTTNLNAPGTPLKTNMTNSFVKVPRGAGKNGQIATGHDLNLGELSVRTLGPNSRTYQLYSNNAGRLSVGFASAARMESVAIKLVRPDELVDIYLSYADAALVEKYRERKHIPSLSEVEVTGFLLVRHPGQTGH
ncbi:uncharacterized protein LOC125664787 [Ostrea edulis]|uniref:uncharacterized protein LOC125664787 n=1 Tax=Ostrea edulis TaxID=37623 RepID=UPI0024AF9D78|nr:uncharacterized protein LOC125664787 [Ostrea edulis]